MSEAEENDLLTVWSTEDTRIAGVDWLTYLGRERDRLAREGIHSDIVSMEAHGIGKRGKRVCKTIYALKRKIQ